MDPHGTPHSAAFAVWDNEVLYALVQGNATDHRGSGATSLLEWEMIKFSAERGRIFDFCGSMLEPLEHFVRSFGSVRVPYYRITKSPFWMKALLLAGKL